jgi:hypothetical protein
VLGIRRGDFVPAVEGSLFDFVSSILLIEFRLLWRAKASSGFQRQTMSDTENKPVIKPEIKPVVRSETNPVDVPATKPAGKAENRQAGKGSKRRPFNAKQFSVNYGSIRWGKKQS